MTIKKNKKRPLQFSPLKAFDIGCKEGAGNKTF